jgi:putative SOS response-associated peptidase YedK
MCANYTPVTRADRLLQYFGVHYAYDRPESDVFPMGFAPFVRLAPPGSEPQSITRFVEEGIFRFVPDFIAKVDWARNTFNARSETVDSKTTFKSAWAKGQRCIIPAESVYEPNYETGSSVRWRINLESNEPMGIAGIYQSWTNTEGEMVFSMAMLTVNADQHPFMQRFHALNDEKRMVVILDSKDYEGWLTCPVNEAKTRYCKAWQGPPGLVGEAMPLPRRAPSNGGKAKTKVTPAQEPKPDPKPRAKPKPKAPAPPVNGQLF